MEVISEGGNQYPHHVAIYSNAVADIFAPRKAHNNVHIKCNFKALPSSLFIFYFYLSSAGE